MENVRFIIPSYNRKHLIGDKTLALLKKYTVPKEHIEIVVETEKMKNEYLEEIGNDYKILVSNTDGIKEKRNWVRRYYQEETDYEYIICLDDDLNDMNNMGKSLTAEEFKELVEDGFNECEKRGLYLWGVVGFDNKFFMKDTVTTKLKTIIGAFWGLIIEREKEPLQTLFNHYEDLDFTCQHFLRDGGVLRYNNISISTKYFNPDGGITHWYGGKEKRQQDQENGAVLMLLKYGKMCRAIKKKIGWDIRLNHHFKIK